MRKSAHVSLTLVAVMAAAVIGCEDHGRSRGGASDIESTTSTRTHRTGYAGGYHPVYGGSRFGGSGGSGSGISHGSGVSRGGFGGSAHSSAS